ncbi:MAG: Hsp20/alpha crystallin family protein [Gammaproteobacteria bacterium]|nr:Hsp20/alpha crystallin family protein [Gammaproteobacteria bacterium]NIR82985.1 Hsp20/alpha crystallin family protein [Gammaproteobacteria bacterium]NIR90616.1 Hsp20/alpha crystallin family protein [Gammaproteobacteria bacterium]NIU04127.1 Hsp20/alpha crystallin family protein [Gammaproteobacteria bacterium]NIV51439.1 Hsp20 family protein [Gammaproteobacteria bacterium]
MAITRYEPWSLLNQLQREIDQLYENRGTLAGAGESSAATSDWIPAVDIQEDADRYVIHADLPGVDSKDIDVTMENGMLTIKGERRFESEEERAGYKRVERAHGSFYRRFSLPDTVAADKISARTNAGVLEVVIPKQEKVQPRKISVES